MIMPAIMTMQKLKLNQNRRRVRGTSMKKLVNSSVYRRRIVSERVWLLVWGDHAYLSRSAPGHVDLEHVSQEGLRDVDGDAA